MTPPTHALVRAPGPSFVHAMGRRTRCPVWGQISY